MIWKQAIVSFLSIHDARTPFGYVSTSKVPPFLPNDGKLVIRHATEYKELGGNGHVDVDFDVEGDGDIISDVEGRANMTQEEANFIRSNIHNDLFDRGLPPDAIELLPTSFDKVEYKKGTVLMKQGDDIADFLILVDDGKCTISIDGKELPYPYGTVGRGTIIGENSLIYKKPRGATVTAKTDVSAWRQSLESFQYFMNIVETEEGEDEDIPAQLLKIDKVIDKISGTKTAYGGNVIKQIQPNRGWLWRRWRGTILQHAWKPTLINMLVTTGFVLAVHSKTKSTLTFGMLPNKSDPFISRILGLGMAWKYTMSITTFILSFFLSQAYNLWRDVYHTARVVQGKLSDINLLLACSAERNEDTGKYTPKAQTLLEDVARYTRLFHAFTWASLSKKMDILLGVRGIRRLTCRGWMTQKECEILSSLKPNVQPQHACLMWATSRILKGMKEGAVTDDHVLRDQIFERTTALQGVFSGIGGKLAGKMPLAYAHFVQILVDVFLFLAPFALYGELGIWSVPAVGILTLFYSGLLDLAKILLDPLDKDDFYNNASVNMDIAVIIRESNAGSTRWMAGGQDLPF
mmetsp:Transcript_3862/g.8480  ORF Transcript_3862/g.8480 Transcript_3862/m.8480 type:complete len:576 (+) Transcript_3862:95-1822(+)